MEKALRYFLPLYVLAYFAAAFVWRSFLVRRSTGVNPYIAGDKNTAHGYAAFLFRLIFLGCLVVVALYAFWPEGYRYLMPIPGLQLPFVVYLGLILLITSLSLIVVAQAQMGESWRIGFDSDSKTALVQKGLYRWSRNPIFLGMRATLVGLFLTLPNVVTLVIMILGNALLQIQVRLEEAYLLKTHGESYQAYCQQTNRWL
ncbi:MAG: isoprenylcysteine carboxylmethyltransferase family protein [Pyrinomonadaceae bacterium]